METNEDQPEIEAVNHLKINILVRTKRKLTKLTIRVRRTIRIRRIVGRGL